MTAPMQKIIRRSAETVEGAWLKYFSFVDLREENTRLKKEVDDLRMQNATAGRHVLELAGLDLAPISHGVFVPESAFLDIGENLQSVL